MNFIAILFDVMLYCACLVCMHLHITPSIDNMPPQSTADGPLCVHACSRYPAPICQDIYCFSFSSCFWYKSKDAEYTFCYDRRTQTRRPKPQIKTQRGVFFTHSTSIHSNAAVNKYCTVRQRSLYWVILITQKEYDLLSHHMDSRRVDTTQRI